MTWARDRWFPKNYSGSNFYSRQGFYAVNRSRADSLAIREYAETGSWKRNRCLLTAGSSRARLAENDMLAVAREAAERGLPLLAIEFLLGTTPSQTRRVLCALGLTDREIRECMDLGQELPQWLRDGQRVSG